MTERQGDGRAHEEGTSKADWAAVVNQTPRSYAVRVALGLEPRFEPSERLKQEAARRLHVRELHSRYVPSQKRETEGVDEV